LRAALVSGIANRISKKEEKEREMLVYAIEGCLTRAYIYGKEESGVR
jgi:hypothetical protein